MPKLVIPLTHVAREWHANKRKSWSPQYADNVLHRLEQDIFPDIGPEPIMGLPHRRIISVLRKIEARGAIEVAKESCLSPDIQLRNSIGHCRP